MIPMFDYYKNKHDLHSTDEIKLGLTAIEAAMEKLGQPQLTVPVIHVAGTNGKGSTIKMMERMAQEHGLHTAVFMSPCIEDVHDQIQFDGQPITEQQMDTAFIEAKKAGLSNTLTDFELLTAIAFIAIKQQGVNLAIIESGMGGRFDSTNVVQSMVAVIPSIAREHTNFLGDTIGEIAWHKAGVIKENSVAVIGELDAEASKVMVEEAHNKNALLYTNGIDFKVDEKGTWTDSSFRLTELYPSLKGPHQMQNMALAIQAFSVVAKHLQITLDEASIRQAVATTTLEGRFECIKPNVWLDGAHNPASAKMLRQTVQQQFPGQRITMIVGILKDKDVVGVLRELEKGSDDFIFVEVEREQKRLMFPEDLVNLSHATHKQISNSVLESVKEKSQENIVIVTGSLYLLAQWRNILRKNL